MFSKIIHEWIAFFTTFMFYTRLPFLRWIGARFKPSHLAASRKYFPLVGWLVGGISCGVLLVALKLFSTEISVLLSMLVGLMITGAFHEDGLADTCDGFGGGYDKGEILSIMKDSHVGAYGALALIVSFSLKFFALVSLCKIYVPVAEPSIVPESVQWVMEGMWDNIWQGVREDVSEYTGIALAEPAPDDFMAPGQWMMLTMFISAHSVSRWCALTFFRTHAYAREDSDVDSKMGSQATQPLRFHERMMALCLGLLPLYWIGILNMIFLIVVCYSVKKIFARRCQRLIGGFTGDTLGATQQLTEITFYLCLIVLS